MENFTESIHPKWTNLKIYPELGNIEKEIGLLNDINFAFSKKGIDVCYKINHKHEELIKKKLNKGYGSFLIVFTDKETILDAEIILGPKINNSNLNHLELEGFSKTLYLSDYAYILLKNLLSNYDNLLCLAMIVKNAGPNFENVLKENLPFFDCWCILDTGSTDGTQETIKRVLQNKRGKLYEEPFINFRDSRNRCLDLAGQTCKFIIMLDDTYILKGDIRKFLNEVRGDTFSDSFSLLIQSEDTEYYSNRIIKSEKKLRYIHTIHEVITDQNNINVTIPASEVYIFDHRSDYMEKRTIERKEFDLELLFNELNETPNDPRTLYYIGQTYGCIGDEINKAKYFEQRIKFDGYIQEKIDALFELARTYNFKVNCETGELMEPNTPLTLNQWTRCEELYNEAYFLDKNRPDSLYFIGIHYYLEKDYSKAYNYFKKAFEIGYPIDSQYSLKPTLSFHFLPKFLTEVCYYLEDYNLGLSSAELFLNKNPQNSNSWNLILNWYNIHKNLKLMQNKEKSVFCIVTDGGWEPWTGKDIETKGLGGSETWIIETARYLEPNYNVIVFCKTLKSEIYNGVSYNPIESFHLFISHAKVEQCVISRYTEYIPVALAGNAENVHFIFHDNIVQDLILPIHKKFKCVWGLTKWHSEIIKNVFPQFNVNYNNYGVNEIKLTEKIKDTFIYSSFPNRGLVVLLRMWPKIKEILPDAVLSVYCNLEQAWVNNIATEMMKEIKETINQPGITNYGWVSKKVLTEAWSKTEYWLYPCIFEETFCLTALEAAISKTKIITNGLAGLSETAKYGFIIPGNPLTTEWQEQCLNILKNKNNTYSFNYLIEENYTFAKSLTWKSQTKLFLNKIKNQ